MENRDKTFYNALLKTKYGANIKKKLKKKAKKLPLSLKALGAAIKFSQDPTIKLEKKVGKSGRLLLEGNPRKKSVGLWYKKSF